METCLAEILGGLLLEDRRCKSEPDSPQGNGSLRGHPPRVTALLQGAAAGSEARAASRHSLTPLWKGKRACESSQSEVFSTAVVLST